jgi:hypothetical protein
VRDQSRAEAVDGRPQRLRRASSRSAGSPEYARGNAFGHQPIERGERLHADGAGFFRRRQAGLVTRIPQSKSQSVLIRVI